MRKRTTPRPPTRRTTARAARRVAARAAALTPAQRSEIAKKAAAKPWGGYSPPICTGIKTTVVEGEPDLAHVSTSYVERSNLSIRIQNRRFTRLTNTFSKKFENHIHALALYFMFYNFVRVHKTLRMSPAMAAGVSQILWTMEDIAERIEANAPKPALGKCSPRGSYKKRVQA